MKGNKFVATLIAIVTFAGPFNFAYMSESSSNMGFKLLMMLLTMAGAIAAVAIGSASSGEHKSA